MGCECIPFAQSEGLIHVVRVTKEIQNGIQTGQNVVDGITTKADEARNYLYRLPSSTQPYYYQHCGNFDAGLSHICDKDSHPICSWPEVVAGIAFGGLVPMATLPLVKTVRFTAAGGSDLGRDGLSLLNSLIMKIQKQAPGSRLFGKYIEDCEKLKENMLVVSLINPSRVKIRTAVALFGRYMTMLEYIAAYNTDNPSDPVGAVFKACCEELKHSYSTAVVTPSSEGGSQVDHNDVPATSLCKEELDEICAMASFNTAACGRIARYIILAWTYYVGIVVRNRTEYRRALTFLDGSKERIYHPLKIEQLPKSALLA